MSSQYPSAIHPAWQLPAVVGPVVQVVPWEVVKPPVVDAAVVVEFPPLPPLGSKHEQSLQYWVFTLGPQQSPPSYVHSILLLLSSQYPSAIHDAVPLHPVVVGPPVVVGDGEVGAVEVAGVVGVELVVVLGVVLGVVVGVVVASEVAVGVVVGVAEGVLVGVAEGVLVGVAEGVVLGLAEGVAVGVVLEVVIVVVVMFSRFEDVKLSERIKLSI